MGKIAIAIAAVVIIGYSAWFISNHMAVRRAGEAIVRADEYWDQSEFLFEPRYLEAEKAVAEVSEVLDSETLKLCLQSVRLSRQSLQIAGVAKDPTDAQSSVKKFRSQSSGCLAPYR
jgi:hypothetical protein